MRQYKNGFTIIELVVVISIFSILAAALFVAIDPNRRIQEQRNKIRITHINQIANAITDYKTKNDNALPDSLDNLEADKKYIIGTCNQPATCGNGELKNDCLNLASLVPDQIRKIPSDPNSKASSQSGYYLMRSAANLITIGACSPEPEGTGGNGSIPVLEITL